MAVAGDGHVMSRLTTAGDLVEDELFGEGVAALGLGCQQVGDGGNIGGEAGIGLNRFDDQLRLSPRSPDDSGYRFPLSSGLIIDEFVRVQRGREM